MQYLRYTKNKFADAQFCLHTLSIGIMY